MNDKELIEKLQAALAFWMPAMGQVDPVWDARIGDDAYLLVGYIGKDMYAPSYYDLTADDAVYVLTPAGKAHLEGKK